MFELLNLALAGGLAAAAAPVIIHLMRRRKVRQVTWGAMRFLEEILARSRKRLFVDELLLLLVRTLVAALIALAFLRPALKQDQDLAGGQRQGRTAAVLLLDDSLSSGAGRGQIGLDHMKRLALAYLDTLSPGDEVSLVRLSQLHGAPADPYFDLEAVKALVSQTQPTAVASDLPALLEAGMVQLSRHLNPGAELVLVTDGLRDGWHADEKTRWDEVRHRLEGPAGATLGSRQKPRLLFLGPETVPVSGNLAVTGLTLDRTLVSVGRPVVIKVAVSRFGNDATSSVTVRLLADGQKVSEQTLTPGGGTGDQISFTHTFAEAGEHFVTAQLEGVADSLPGDDSRTLSLVVADPVPVLLVDGGTATGFESKLGFLAAALDPETDGKGQFRLSRSTPELLNEAALQGQRVVVLGDVSNLSPAAIDALERHVVSGGGILVGLGPQSDAKVINQVWGKGGDGFLPANLKAVEKPSIPAAVSRSTTGHPAFHGLGQSPGETFAEARIRTWVSLDLSKGKTAGLDRLLTLEGGPPLLALRRRGLGLSALWTTSLNGDWNDLPVHPAYVPMMRSLVGHLGSFIMPPRNLRPGDALSLMAPPDATAEGPGSIAVKLLPGTWEGRPAMVSEPLLKTGGYTVRAGPQTARFAVATAPEESALEAVPKDEVITCLAGLKYQSLHTESEIAAKFSAGGSSVEIWRWLLAGTLVFLFLETFLTRREAGLGGLFSKARTAS